MPTKDYTDKRNLQEIEILEGINPHDMAKCLEIALQNRSAEIGLLWQRALLFWGFIAILMVAIAESKTTNPHLATILSLMGVMFSSVWVLVNRGSKSWQETWEIKAEVYSKHLYGTEALFRRAVNYKEPKLLLSPKRYSVSNLLIALSYYVLVFWIGSVTYLFYEHVSFSFLKALVGLTSPYLNKDSAVILFALFTFVSLSFVILKCRSSDETILND